MEKYNCEICGKKHNVYVGIESPLPELIENISEEEREKRIHGFGGVCIIDQKIVLINGYIHISLENQNEPFFSWKIWVETKLEEFKKNIDSLTKSEKVELNGKILSEIPFYEKSKGLDIKIIMDSMDESSIEIEIKEESNLKEDQINSISDDRVIELMQRINHPELFRKKIVFDKPFSSRLNQELINAEEIYLMENKNFAINIASPNSVLFQIINRNMLETVEDEGKGFGLHLSFDDSFEESKEEMHKFNKNDSSEEFQYHDLDEIPTYQIDLRNDKSKIESLVKKLIKDVYNQEIETIEIDNFEI